MLKKNVGDKVTLSDGKEWFVKEIRSSISGVATPQSSENAEVSQIRVELEGQSKWISPSDIKT